MLLRALFIILMSLASCLLYAQQMEGVDALCIDETSDAPADVFRTSEEDLSVPGDTALAPPVGMHRMNYGFDADGFILKKNKHEEEYWSHVPEDCHIDWRRHRKHPFIDFCMDLARFFNTYDTTYVERNRYNFRVMANNTDFFQVYRVAAREGTNTRQMLTFAPGNVIKFGPRIGWRWLNFGYTIGALSKREYTTSELNFSAYNSRIGFDLNWQHCSGPFRMRRVRGFDGVPEYSVKGYDVKGISTNTIAVNAYYVFNYRHFAYPAAYNASSVQLKSAGSWLLGVTYDYQHFNFDPDIAESVIQSIYLKNNKNSTAELPRFIDALRVRVVNYHRIGIGVGYGYNWVPAPHWLVAASVSPSFGFKKQAGVNISKEMIADNIRNFHIDAILRGGVVYNRQRWFAGFSVVSYLYDYRHRNFDLNNSVTYIKVYLGVQFYKRKKFCLATDRSRW